MRKGDSHAKEVGMNVKGARYDLQRRKGSRYGGERAGKVYRLHHGPARELRWQALAASASGSLKPPL